MKSHMQNKLLCFSAHLLFFSAIALIVLYPLIKTNAIPYGWDARFHLNRIEELAISIKNGHLFPSNGLNSFSNFGLAINSFYPYLFLYPFAVARLLLNPIHAYFLTIWIYLVCAQFISYYSALKIRPLKKGALIFSTVYNLSGYLILQISMRSDLGEYFALILFPIAFVGAFSLLEGDTNSRKWLYLPLGMAAILYSHVLSVLILGFSLALWLLFNCRFYTKTNFKKIGLSSILFVLLTLPVLSSTISVMKSNDIEMPKAPGPLSSQAIDFGRLLTNSMHNTVTDQLKDCNLGTIVIFLFVALILIFPVSSNFTKQMTLLSLFFFLSVTSIFPWRALNASPLKIIQFPWRLLGPTTLFIASGAASLADLSWVRTKYQKISKIAIVTLELITILAGLNITRQFVKWPLYHVTATSYEWFATQAVYSDYMPKDSVKSLKYLTNRIAIINDKKVQLSPEAFVTKGNSIDFSIDHLRTNDWNKVRLPVLIYSYDKNLQSKSKQIQTSLLFLDFRQGNSTHRKFVYRQKTPRPSFGTMLIALFTLVTICSQINSKNNLKRLIKSHLAVVI